MAQFEFLSEASLLSLRSILREADMHVGRNCTTARQILHGLKAVQDDAGVGALFELTIPEVMTGAFALLVDSPLLTD